MKKQTVQDRVHEGEGMTRYEMRKHTSSAHESSHRIYCNEVDMPELAPQGHMLPGMGCMDFKGESDPIAYGQAGGSGCKSDEHKIHSQFKDYHWNE